MGWFSRSSKTKESNEPSRENRKKCWETRDAYFDCLDGANVVKAGEEGNVCTKEKQLYEDNCAKSWVRPRWNYRCN
jgi:cytochrome c oxidase assembly factor 6